MTASSQNAARFRPATDFPKTVSTLAPEEVVVLYDEMRECLLFTNRSRGQLIRRNSEHKEKAVALRSCIGTLQGLIDQLQSQKQNQLQESETIIAQLASEMREMDSQLNTLSQAFDAVGDIESEAQSQWGRLLFPTRIMALLKAVRSLMQWYKKDDKPTLGPDAAIVEVGTVDEQHRRDYPEQYTDQASINRDLLDR
jgi:hypothetical protein